MSTRTWTQHWKRLLGVNCSWSDVCWRFCNCVFIFTVLQEYKQIWQLINTWTRNQDCEKIFFRSEDCLGSAFHITEDQFMNQVLITADFWEFVHTVIKLDLRHETLYLRQYGHAYRCYGIHAGICVGIWLFQLGCSALQVGQRDKRQKNKLKFWNPVAVVHFSSCTQDHRWPN